MFEHPSDIYNAIVVEQDRVDRANELRRIIAENPDRVIMRRRSVRAWARDRFGSRNADAAAPAPAFEGARATVPVSESPRATGRAPAPESARTSGDAAARPVHAQ